VTPQRWQQIETVYHAALERDANGRPALLDQLCGDDRALRLEVESLLILEPEAVEFLEIPTPYLRVAAPKQEVQRSGFKGALLRGAGFLFAKRTLQLATIAPIAVLGFIVVKNPDRTLADLIGSHSGYFYWIAVAAITLKFGHRIRTWIDRNS